MRVRVLLLSFMLTACDRGLPVRLELCDPHTGDECYTAARFREQHDCELHREVSEMTCDRSKPGEIHCVAPPKPGVSRCVR
jgi:hypothetical protein